MAWWIKLIACMIAYIFICSAFGGDAFQWYHALTLYLIGVISATK